jgi:hypothetical protein
MQPPTTPLTTGFFRLAWILQGMLRLNALLALAEICYYVWTVDVLNHWVDDPSDYKLVTAQLIDNLSRADAIATGVLILGTGILFISWLHRANLSDRIDQNRMRRGAGWAIGGWFLPIGNLFLPFQQVGDVYRAAFAARHEGKPITGTTLLGWWWAMWLCSGAMSWIAIANSGKPTDDGVQVLRDLRTEDITDLFGSVLMLAAALLAVAVVGRITALLQRP